VAYWRQDVVSMPSDDFYASFYIFEPFKKPGFTNGYTKLFGYHGDFEYRTDLKKVVCIFSNESDFNGPMRLKLDWKKLGFDSWKNLTVKNAVHSTGVRVENFGKEDQREVLFPKRDEYAEIENGELVFPMSEWSFRMIVIERRRPDAYAQRRLPLNNMTLDR